MKRQKPNVKPQKAASPWSLLRKRLEAPDRADPTIEWVMSFAEGDNVGIAAWAIYAERLGAHLRADHENHDEAVLTWDFPVIPKMTRALAMAEKIEKSATSGLVRQRISRILLDLRSYRDTGLSATSPLKSETGGDEKEVPRA